MVTHPESFSLCLTLMDVCTVYFLFPQNTLAVLTTSVVNVGIVMICFVCMCLILLAAVSVLQLNLQLTRQ